MTRNTRIRPALPDDAHAIATVQVSAWQDAYQGLMPQDYLDKLSIADRASRWRRRLTEIRLPAAGVLVAQRATTVVGFVGFGPTRDWDARSDPARVGEITTIYLLAEVRGSGLGQRLMAAAVENMTAAGYAEATLWVLDSNARARRFYDRAGWAMDGYLQHEEIGGFTVTEVRYRRRLTA